MRCTTLTFAPALIASDAAVWRRSCGLETLLLGVPAFFGVTGPGSNDPLRQTALAVVGVIVSGAWWLQLRSYRQLNRAKFNVILAIERDHFSIQPFTDEWASLKTDQVPGWRERYAELGTVERVVPIVFAVANGVLIVWAWL